VTKLHRPGAAFRPAGSVARLVGDEDRCPAPDVGKRLPDRLARPAHLDATPWIVAGAEGLVDLHLDRQVVHGG
jgi:hypothetical protein